MRNAQEHAHNFIKSFIGINNRQWRTAIELRPGIVYPSHRFGFASKDIDGSKFDLFDALLKNFHGDSFI